MTSEESRKDWPADHYERFLDAIPESLLVVNAEGRTIFCNEKACELFGRHKSQILSFSIVRLIPDWYTLPAAGPTLESNAVDGRGRLFRVEVKLAPVQTPEGPVLIALLRGLGRRIAEISAEKEVLREQVEQLSSREREIRTEMVQAATILESHLPPASFSIPNLEVSWKFSPCNTLGGDMIKLFPISDSIVGFTILDVSGHGIPASLLAISLSRSLSTDRTRGGILESSRGALRKPSEVLTRINEQYHILHEGEQFATMTYGILDISRKALRYASAGHPHPILVSEGKAVPVRGPINPPVGILRSLEYFETVARVEPGETLVLYTDGVTETRNVAGEFFGEPALLEFLTRFGARSTSSLVEQLYVDLEAFRQGREQTDDVTTLVMRLTSP